MAILDVSPVRKAEDERQNSQYLTPRNLHPEAVIKDVFVNVDPEKWTEECSQALRRAKELATRLTSRVLQRGLIVTAELDALQWPTANDLLRRLIEWLHINGKSDHPRVEMLHEQINLPQIVLLEYYGDEEKPEVTSLCSPRLIHRFLDTCSELPSDLTSRFIFINLGRHTKHADCAVPDASSFDYSLVWLGALLEVLDIDSYALRAARVKDFRHTFMAHHWSDYLQHKLPPSERKTQREKQAAESFDDYSFFVPCASVLASHHSSRYLTTEPLTMYIRPALIISHFDDARENSKRPWTGICVAADTESFFLRKGDYATEDIIDEALVQSIRGDRTIEKDPTKPLRHVYQKCVGSILECLAKTEQFLNNFEVLIQRRPFELSSDPLFENASLLRKLEFVVQEYREQLFSLPRGPAVGQPTDWTESQSLDFDFVDERIAEMHARLVQTRALLFNNISILESQEISKLTNVAFIFIPITFVATVFGMNVSALSGPGPSIGIFFAFAIMVSVLTFAVTAGYKPTMLFIRRKISFYDRRWRFFLYLRSLKRKGKRNAKEYEDTWTKALEEKQQSYLALLNIVEKWHAKSRLQDRLESPRNREAADSSVNPHDTSVASCEGRSADNVADSGPAASQQEDTTRTL